MLRKWLPKTRSGGAARRGVVLVVAGTKRIEVQADLSTMIFICFFGLWLDLELDLFAGSRYERTASSEPARSYARARSSDSRRRVPVSANGAKWNLPFATRGSAGCSSKQWGGRSDSCSRSRAVLTAVSVEIDASILGVGCALCSAGPNAPPPRPEPAAPMPPSAASEMLPRRRTQWMWWTWRCVASTRRWRGLLKRSWKRTGEGSFIAAVVTAAVE